MCSLSWTKAFKHSYMWTIMLENSFISHSRFTNSRWAGLISSQPELYACDDHIGDNHSQWQRTELGQRICLKYRKPFLTHRDYLYIQWLHYLKLCSCSIRTSTIKHKDLFVIYLFVKFYLWGTKITWNVESDKKKKPPLNTHLDYNIYSVTKNGTGDGRGM